MVKTVDTPIVPSHQIFIGEQRTLDHEAICVFAATGFFLDQDTYYKELKVLKPGHVYSIDEAKQEIINEKPWFKWHHSPREISFDEAVREYGAMFEKIVDEQVGNQTVILPLSGGLDSRTQAAALKQLGKKVNSYSYSFEGGLNEALYGRKIAAACDFKFEDWRVPRGYLWNCIGELATINQCYSEFTHNRQMAFRDRYSSMGDIFSLGHWGDVLFDGMGVEDQAPLEQQIHLVLKKIVKKGGLELGRALWQAWELHGSFDDYLHERIGSLLKAIDIPDSANARIRAFKSMYWAPRWTTINLSVFQSVRPVSLPYYDNRMCEFICTLPEKYLWGRKMQIEYLKQRSPRLASIPWQEHHPFNLYQYEWDKVPYNLPYRIWSKMKRTLNPKKFIQRNWELQFLGVENDSNLRQYLFDNDQFREVIPADVTNQFYSNFTSLDRVRYSHSVSMLLTLSVMAKQNLNQQNHI